MAELIGLDFFNKKAENKSNHYVFIMLFWFGSYLKTTTECFESELC